MGVTVCNFGALDPYACLISKVVCFWESNTFAQVIYIDEEETGPRTDPSGTPVQISFVWGHIIF